MHLILGETHARFDEGEDRRLHPFTPGARRQAAVQKWQLVEKPGIHLSLEDGNPQPGWLELDLDKIDQPPARPAPASTEPPKESLQQEIDHAAHDSEVDRLKEEIQDLRNNQAPAPATCAGNLAERLRILKQLRQEELISEEELQQKKRELLKEL